MIAKVGWVLFAVSLGFNVFFAVGSYRAREELEQARRHNDRLNTFPGQAEAYVEQLDLDIQQREEFEMLMEETMQERERICRESMTLLNRFLKEVVKEDPDREVIAQYIHSPYVTQHRKLMADKIREFMTVLRPPQRRMLADSIRDKVMPKDIQSQVVSDSDTP